MSKQERTTYRQPQGKENNPKEGRIQGVLAGLRKPDLRSDQGGTLADLAVNLGLYGAGGTVIGFALTQGSGWGAIVGGGVGLLGGIARTVDQNL